MSGASFPEGYVLLIILFVFPYLMSRKLHDNYFRDVIHSFMDDTYNWIERKRGLKQNAV